MHVLFIDIWMTVSDYNTNPTVIILVGIGILKKCMFYSLISGWQYQTIFPDWNLNEMHVLFIGIWMTVSDYNTNPTVIILVGIGILTKCIFYLFISG
jgi:hypothetical protein